MNFVTRQRAETVPTSIVGKVQTNVMDINFTCVLCVYMCLRRKPVCKRQFKRPVFFSINKIRFTCLVSGTERIRCIYERNHKSGIHLRIHVRPFHVHMIKSLSFLRCVITVVFYVCKEGSMLVSQNTAVYIS